MDLKDFAKPSTSGLNSENTLASVVKNVFSTEISSKKGKLSTGEDEELGIPLHPIKNRSIFTMSSLTQADIDEAIRDRMFSGPESENASIKCKVPRMDKYQCTLLVGVMGFIIVMSIIVYLSTK